MISNKCATLWYHRTHPLTDSSHLICEAKVNCLQWIWRYHVSQQFIPFWRQQQLFSFPGWDQLLTLELHRDMCCPWHKVQLWEVCAGKQPTALLPCQAPGRCLASAIPGHNQLLLLPHQAMRPLQMGSAGRKFVFLHMYSSCHVFEKIRTRILGHSPTKSGCGVFYFKLLL